MIFYATSIKTLRGKGLCSFNAVGRDSLAAIALATEAVEPSASAALGRDK
jgi:hypothetical protein